VAQGGAGRLLIGFRAMSELAADFRRDGACVVRGLLDAAEVERLAAAVDAHMADPGPMAIEGGGDAGSGRFFEDFRNWDRFEGYDAVIRGSRLGQVAAELMGSRTVRLHHDHLLVKEPGTTIRTPWHQDQPYYNIDGSDTVSFWIPLDPVPRESSLEFVAGSHASGTWYMPRSFFDDRALVFDEGAFGEVPDVEADRDAFEILGWPLEPGDAVAFNMLTLHAAAGSRRRRRAFSVRLVGDDVRLAARAHATSPPFPELDGRLAPGDELDHPLFPLLWPRV
jgi:ectoine hydroxylase-related dioxygenase (phytanoyl-CoA dioxygenase family)